MKKLIFASIPIFVLFLFSCSSKDDDPIDPPTNDVTYKDNIKKIIDSNCISCHASTPINGAPMALVTLADVKEAMENRNLTGRIKDGSMPPGDIKIDADDIKMIEDWKKNNFKP